MKPYRTPKRIIVSDTRPYSALRGKLAEMNIDQRYLAKLLNRSIWYIVERLAGRSPWDMDDMYAMLDLIGEPHELLNHYYPLESRKRAEAS